MTTRQYKSGFCIDGGGYASDLLSYANCPTSFPTFPTFIWNGNYYSQWYYTWEWIAPGGTNARNWSHSGAGTGYARDWGSKWGPLLGCN